MSSRGKYGKARLGAWLRLSGLAARRTLPLALLFGALISSAILLRGALGGTSPSQSSGLDLARLATSAMPAAAQHGATLRFFFESHGVWILIVTLVAPFLLWRAAVQSGGSARRVDRLWLDVRPVGSFFVSTAQLFGSAFAASFSIAALSLLVLFAKPEGTKFVDAAAGWASGPEDRLFDGELRWTAPALQQEAEPLRARLSLRLITGGTDPVLNVEFSSRRTGSKDWNTSLVRVGDGAALEVEVPPGQKGAEFKLVRIEGGARALVRSNQLALYRPLAAPRGILRLGLRILLGLSAAIALALGLGHYISAPSAASAAILPWVLSFLAPQLSVLEFLPAGDLAFALEEWAEGRAPAALQREAWIGAALLLSLGLALAILGRKRSEV